MSWRLLEAGAPALAGVGRGRFQAAGIALLGTLRPDGTPRISPVEPHVLSGELAFAVMASPKWEDLKRDPRCVLHSAIPDGSGDLPEFKVYGRAHRTDDPALVRAEGAWWTEQPPEAFEVFVIEITEVVLVAWDTGFGRMRTQRWRPDEGAAEAERTYP
jgi:hypothetical protein